MSPVTLVLLVRGQKLHFFLIPLFKLEGSADTWPCLLCKLLLTAYQWQNNSDATTGSCFFFFFFFFLLLSFFFIPQITKSQLRQMQQVAVQFRYNQLLPLRCSTRLGVGRAVLSGLSSCSAHIVTAQPVPATEMNLAPISLFLLPWCWYNLYS